MVEHISKIKGVSGSNLCATLQFPASFYLISLALKSFSVDTFLVQSSAPGNMREGGMKRQVQVNPNVGFYLLPEVYIEGQFFLLKKCSMSHK